MDSVEQVENKLKIFQVDIILLERDLGILGEMNKAIDKIVSLSSDHRNHPHMQELLNQRTNWQSLVRENLIEAHDKLIELDRNITNLYGNSDIHSSVYTEIKATFVAVQTEKQVFIPRYRRLLEELNICHSEQIPQ